MQLTQAIQFSFPITNNEVDYEAMLLGLKLVLALDIMKIEIKCDSQQVVSQIKGEFKAKEERMVKYLTIAKTMLARFEQFSISKIPRDENETADSLTNFASNVPRASHVEIQILNASSTAETQVRLVEEGPPES